MNETHNPRLRSWAPDANEPDGDFPIQNLPFGVFSREKSGDRHIGVAIGSRILDLSAVAQTGLLDELDSATRAACCNSTLNALMGLTAGQNAALRRRLSGILREGTDDARRRLGESCLTPMTTATMHVPAAIGDYTDFYASIYHATNVGRMFRPDNPLLPNYKYVPIAYHGRASSIVASGTAIRRPAGQTRPNDSAPPQFGPTRLLDYELEVGAFVGRGNDMGAPVAIEDAHEHLFGLCLVNDWSARDMQKWEYQPLGPFLAKSFATTVSPWVVTLEALAPFRAPAFERPAGDPSPLPYLSCEQDRKAGGIDVTLDVFIESESMRRDGVAPHQISSGSFLYMYWTISQMLTHHASNGCNLRPGDLMASGTVSGPEESSRGCLLEMTQRGAHPVALPDGTERKFLLDGDRLIIRGYCARDGVRRIGFGECSGTVVA